MLKRIIPAAMIAVLSISAIACSTAPTDKSSDASSKAALSGTVIVDGSGTVYPLMATIAEEYMINEQTDVSIEVGRAGTSAGFKKFIPGETDFSDASRAIKAEEITQLTESGIIYETDVLEIKIALDGLTMVINKDNTWATEMTKDEILGMFVSGTYKADDKVLWSDIRSAWPAEEIMFYGPNENHGTYEFFHEVLLKKANMVKTADLQQEYSTLVDLVSNDKNAIAFFGFGYYVSNTDKLTAVKVDFGSGAVEPTLETIGEDLGYAGFTRPVYTYVNLKHAQSKPQVLDFAKYVVSPEGALRLAGENGFAPLPAAVYEGYLATLDAIG
ncbi:MAG: PstS family phosphate ABC transporter substrate-binding protein [Saccharofermentanales bacterium]